MSFIFGIITNYTSAKYGFDPATKSIYLISKGNQVLSIIASLAEGIITAGYVKYLLDFVRTGEFNASTIIDTLKAKWLELIIAIVLMSIIIAIGFVFLVIPGIILALGFSMVTFIVVDTDTKGADALKASWNMMNGYKWDYFVFGLSFLGWILLTPFTLGILLIWLIPYMSVAGTIYYDKLKSLKK